MQRILISRCLLGEMCRWDGKQLRYDISDLLMGHEPLAVCPEMEGGLSCPRPKAEIENGNGADILDGRCRVINASGLDVTPNFIAGAQAALNLAVKHGVKQAVLKEKSPSCGVELIYNNGRLVRGMGVTTALLQRQGIEVRGYGA